MLRPIFEKTVHPRFQERHQSGLIADQTYRNARLSDFQSHLSAFHSTNRHFSIGFDLHGSILASRGEVATKESDISNTINFPQITLAKLYFINQPAQVGDKIYFNDLVIRVK
tara:strand:- start:158 stop:493 length:336 start_codon:yes stop_codon:yes gene_type:complete